MRYHNSSRNHLTMGLLFLVVAASCVHTLNGLSLAGDRGESAHLSLALSLQQLLLSKKVSAALIRISIACESSFQCHLRRRRLGKVTESSFELQIEFVEPLVS